MVAPTSHFYQSGSISVFMALSHLRLSGADLALITEEGSFCDYHDCGHTCLVFVCGMLISMELFYKDSNWLAGTLHSTGHLQLIHQVHYLESCVL